MEDELSNDSHPAVNAVIALAEENSTALDLLEEFCSRFYWIKDHPDYQEHVREFLTNAGRSPHPYGG
jgi:hypothetical protein